MQRLHGRVYLPALRTRESELKGYDLLTPGVKDALLPVFELTKSRRSPKNPEGSLEKTLERLLPAVGDRPFIADVTSLDSQGSAEVAALLEPAGSFANWRAFVRQRLPRTCVPVVHLSDPFDLNEVVEQINDLFDYAGAVALRVPTDYPYAAQLAGALHPRLGMPGFVALLVDDGYVHQHGAAASLGRCLTVLQHFAGKVNLVAPLTSCFPSSVTIPNFGGGDGYGEFRLEEVLVSEQLKLIGLQGADVMHGDYALIHPNDFDGVVTNWVPRVDIPLDQEGYYHRYRRDDGGYSLAARMALQNPKYVKLKCWADQVLVEAAQGNPPGRSPSFWIAARVNYHITRQVHRLAPNVLL